MRIEDASGAGGFRVERARSTVKGLGRMGGGLSLLGLWPADE